MFELAHELMARAASVLKLAIGIHDGKRMQGPLRQYISKAWVGAATIEVIAEPVIALQQAEKASPQIETVAEPLRLVSNG